MHRLPQKSIVHVHMALTQLHSFEKKKYGFTSLLKLTILSFRQLHMLS